MATMNTVIEYIDRVKPNAFSNDDKYKWINALEGLVCREVTGDDPPEYNLPEDADTPLLVGMPYDDIYHLYVSAMIDLYNREYNDYNNTVLVFAERMDQYKAQYIRTHRTSKAKNFRNVMG